MERRTKITGTIENRLVICAALLALYLFGGALYLAFFGTAAQKSGWRPAIFALLFLLWLAFTFFFLVQPYLRVRRILRDFNRGLLHDEIFSLPLPLTAELDAALEKLEELLNKKELLRMSMEQSKYLALQNQISPHFLYNTLDAIRGDALAAGLEQLSDTIEALSAYFSYSITKLEQYATVEEELRSVQDYITVQQYRFGDKLKLEVDFRPVDCGPDELYMPRFVLQPLVENAIYHGFEVREKRGTVCIRIEATRTNLFIDVCDDGVGMEWSKVELLNQKLMREGERMEGTGGGKGIAMTNVNSRIKLLFGNEYGMYVYSTEDVGTDVRIQLPLVWEKE